MLKVLFAGTPDVAVPSLKLLAQDTEHFEVVAVLTRPDAPTGRGRKLVANPVKQAALELGLPVIESDPSEETFVSELAATGAQAAAVVAYGKILKQAPVIVGATGMPQRVRSARYPHPSGAAYRLECGTAGAPGSSRNRRRRRPFARRARAGTCASERAVRPDAGLLPT